MGYTPIAYDGQPLGISAVAWTNTANQIGPGPAISANANSGPIQVAPFSSLLLMVAILTAPTGTTPTLTITINALDPEGNLYPIGATSALNATGNTLLQSGPGAPTNNFIIPTLAQVSWVVGGTTPNFPNVEMTLIGR